jgi:hypothetical protein
LERFQGKVLRMMTDAPWYVPNMVLWQDLQITSVKEEIHRFSNQYRDRNIPTTSQFTSRYHQISGDWDDICPSICPLDFVCKCSFRYRSFSYVVLDISIIPLRPTRLITLITTEGHSSPSIQSSHQYAECTTDCK